MLPASIEVLTPKLWELMDDLYKNIKYNKKKSEIILLRARYILDNKESLGLDKEIVEILENALKNVCVEGSKSIDDEEAMRYLLGKSDDNSGVEKKIENYDESAQKVYIREIRSCLTKKLSAVKGMYRVTTDIFVYLVDLLAKEGFSGKCRQKGSMVLRKILGRKGISKQSIKNCGLFKPSDNDTVIYIDGGVKTVEQAAEKLFDIMKENKRFIESCLREKLELVKSISYGDKDFDVVLDKDVGYVKTSNDILKYDTEKNNIIFQKTRFSIDNGKEIILLRIKAVYKHLKRLIHGEILDIVFEI
jgi:hypothetical protein